MCLRAGIEISKEEYLKYLGRKNIRIIERYLQEKTKEERKRLDNEAKTP